MSNKSIGYDISAEFLLNYLYPDKKDQWIANCEGVFRRNYSPDVLSFSEEDSSVRLSRDGFMDLMPGGLLAADDELLGDDFELRYEELMRRKDLFQDLFIPENTIFFRNRLSLESHVSSLLKDKVNYLLLHYFHYDWQAETSPLVKEVAPLLLMIRNLRADFGFIKNMLEVLLQTEVEMKVGQYSWGEEIEQSQPEIRYDILIPNLSAEEYNELTENIEPLKSFLEEWFIPFDTHCVIAIKHHGQSFRLDRGWILDYNTETI